MRLSHPEFSNFSISRQTLFTVFSASGFPKQVGVLLGFGGGAAGRGREGAGGIHFGLFSLPGPRRCEGLGGTVGEEKGQDQPLTQPTVTAAPEGRKLRGTLKSGHPSCANLTKKRKTNKRETNSRRSRS